jgi:DNA-binding transcriptional ArsR family regulator
MSAGEIAQHFPIAKSTLSGRFDLLKDARLLVSERRGTMIICGPNVSVYE